MIKLINKHTCIWNYLYSDPPQSGAHGHAPHTGFHSRFTFHHRSDLRSYPILAAMSRNIFLHSTLSSSYRLPSQPLMEHPEQMQVRGASNQTALLRPSTDHMWSASIEIWGLMQGIGRLWMSSWCFFSAINLVSSGFGYWICSKKLLSSCILFAVHEKEDEQHKRDFFSLYNRIRLFPFPPKVSCRFIFFHQTDASNSARPEHGFSTYPQRLTLPIFWSVDQLRSRHPKIFFADLRAPPSKYGGLGPIK